MQMERTSNGVPYEWHLVGPEGASFTLHPEYKQTDKQIEEAQRELHRDRDVVGMIKVQRANHPTVPSIAHVMGLVAAKQIEWKQSFYFQFVDCYPIGWRADILFQPESDESATHCFASGDTLAEAIVNVIKKFEGDAPPHAKSEKG
jgi:hypothetical protein